MAEAVHIMIDQETEGGGSQGPGYIHQGLNPIGLLPPDTLLYPTPPGPQLSRMALTASEQVCEHRLMVDSPNSNHKAPQLLSMKIILAGF